MKLQQSAPIRKPLPLTPLVDVVFLLLMFFMLTTTFSKFGNLNFGLGSASSGRAAAQQKMPGLLIKVGAGPAVRVNGEAVALTHLPVLLNDFSGKGVTSAVLSASSGATVQDLVSVLEMARNSTLRTILVAG